MKPFDLEAAKRGEPLMTADGREVKFVAYEPAITIPHHQVILAITGELRACSERGEVVDYGPHRDDVFMAPRKRTVWVNLYGRGNPAVIECGLTTFKTREKAVENSRYKIDTYIGAFPIEIEE